MLTALSLCLLALTPAAPDAPDAPDDDARAATPAAPGALDVGLGGHVGADAVVFFGEPPSGAVIVDLAPRVVVGDFFGGLALTGVAEVADDGFGDLGLFFDMADPLLSVGWSPHFDVENHALRAEVQAGYIAPLSPLSSILHDGGGFALAGDGDWSWRPAPLTALPPFAERLVVGAHLGVAGVVHPLPLPTNTNCAARRTDVEVVDPVCFLDFIPLGFGFGATCPTAALGGPGQLACTSSVFPRGLVHAGARFGLVDPGVVAGVDVAVGVVDFPQQQQQQPITDNARVAGIPPSLTQSYSLTWTPLEHLHVGAAFLVNGLLGFDNAHSRLGLTVGYDL